MPYALREGLSIRFEGEEETQGADDMPQVLPVVSQEPEAQVCLQPKPQTAVSKQPRGVHWSNS